jgi:transcriptional regulator with XRE-family HTH domain
MLNLTKFREARGWNRTELGRRARLHPATVGKLEAKKSVAYGTQLKQLARALGLSVDAAPTLLDEVTTADVLLSEIESAKCPHCGGEI